MQDFEDLVLVDLCHVCRLSCGTVNAAFPGPPDGRSGSPTDRHVLWLTNAIAAGHKPLAVARSWRRWVSAVWRRPAPTVRTAMARALRLPTSTTSRSARVTAV